MGKRKFHNLLTKDAFYEQGEVRVSDPEHVVTLKEHMQVNKFPTNNTCWSSNIKQFPSKIVINVLNFNKIISEKINSSELANA